jgi:adenylate cyclase
MECAHQAARLARKLGHPFSQAYAMNFLCTLSQLRGDIQAVAEHAEVQIVLCKTYGFPFWGAMGKMFLAWATATQGSFTRAVEDFKQALHDYEQCGSRIARSYFLTLLARLQLEAGEPAAAVDTIESALQETAISGEKFFLAELMRIKGKVLMVQPQSNLDTAETVLNQALDISRQQSAHSLSLRIANSLARLLLRQQRSSEASELLQSQLSHIQGGENTEDVLTTHRLLEGCSSGKTQA